MDRLLDERPLPGERPDPYAAIPDLYDLEHEGLTDDVELYKQFAYASGDPILELACGTGRILVPLARAGYRVTGVDLSEPMLDRARDALESIVGVPDYHLVALDMANAASAPGGPFGLVIIGLNSLLHATDADEQRRVLAGARQACDDQGQLIIDVLNPSPEALQQLAGTALDGSWEMPDGTRVMKTSDRKISSADQIIATTMWYDVVAPDGTMRRRVTGFELRWLYPSELLLMLELTGWQDIQVYGSWELDPLTDTSERLIVTARPAQSSPIETF
ncbi:MAG TPA: class I SAM-dependent methyltransferase [Thermomicrobiales bacterium]|jgi:2-polyprenyl-3-methyl-5-hydroxy-6-metoxy-1,4-benzoquinol methylase|nr:class I SAM-dependent methyltransferase [Thermomicrobiales bacterium]